LFTWTATSNVKYRLENSADLVSTDQLAAPGGVRTLGNTASKLDPLTPRNRLYPIRVLSQLNKHILAATMALSVHVDSPRSSGQAMNISESIIDLADLGLIVDGTSADKRPNAFS